MNNVDKQIVLVDWLPSVENVSMGLPSNELFFIDPYNSICRGQWKNASERLEVLNDIYGQVFEHVVIKGKQLVCYWPEMNFNTTETYELSKIQNEFRLGISLYKKNYAPIDVGLSYEELMDWKAFAITLIQSIAEDIHLNEELEEVMSLDNSESGVSIFTTRQNGVVNYCYFYQDKISTNKDLLFSELEFFETFESLLSRLSKDFSLYDYVSSFHDRKYEKMFYSYLLKNKNEYNFIPFWKGYLNNN